MIFARDQWPDLSIDEIVRRVKILVIDDQEFPYAKLFRKDGYNLDKWRDVLRLVDIEQGKYDLILLDLQGVGGAVSVTDQGLGVLKHIKSTNPTQLVIAYSNSEFPLRYQSFFDLADGVLSKSADYVEFKKKVDSLLKDHFSVGFHVSKMEQLMSQSGVSRRKGARLARKAIRSQNVDSMRKYLSRQISDSITVERVISIAQLAISVARLWMS